MCILGPAWALDTYGILRVLREINEVYFREALSVQRLLPDDFGARHKSEGYVDSGSCFVWSDGSAGADLKW